MNALPSFNPPPQSPPPRQRSRRTTTTATSVSRGKTRVESQSNLAYAHRRQGLEALVKLVMYSTLSVLGIGAVVNLLGYNWMQQTKLQQISTGLKDVEVRAGKIQTSFSRSFDPRSQQSLVEENSYKTIPNRLPIIISPAPTQPSPTKSADSPL